MSKILVAYFSASGVTAKKAKTLAESIGADVYEIKPKIAYTKQDLNWMNPRSRSSVEMKDKTSRPELSDNSAPVDGQDTILLGFPIWWYVAPTIINTFLETYDFSGKTIVLFATSGGSGFGKTVDGLKSSAPNAIIKEGKILNRLSDAQIKEWVSNL